MGVVAGVLRLHHVLNEVDDMAERVERLRPGMFPIGRAGMREGFIVVAPCVGEGEVLPADVLKIRLEARPRIAVLDAPDR